MSKFKILIHGYGNIGKRHHKVLTKLNLKKITCFTSKSQNIKNKIFNYQKNYKKKIASIISTPSSMHLQNALFYAKNKINIFVEKPISNNIKKKNFLLLKKLIRKNKLIFQVGYCLKFLKSSEIFYNLLNKTLKKEKVLQINLESFSNLKDWGKQKKNLRHPATYRKFGGGVILEMSHEIDILRWLLGEIKYVYCSSKNNKVFKSDVEDSCNFIADFENKLQAIVSMSYSNYKLSRFIEIITDKSVIKWNIYKGNILINKKTYFQSKKNHFSEMYTNQMKYFLKHLEKGQKIDYKHSIENSIKTLRVIESLKKSNRTKKRVRVAN